MIKPFTIRKYIFTIIFWFAFGVFLWLNFQSDDGKLNALFQTCAILISSFIFTQLLTVKLLPKALRSKRMKWFLIQSILIIFSLSILFSLIFTYIRVDRSAPLPPNFSGQIPLLWKGFYLSISASFLINGTACGIKFYQEHGKIERDHILLQQAHLENQLKLLQDQINPHVMFNILNHIHILMKSNTELASFLLLKFSDILRYQLYHCNQNLVVLDGDIQYLQDLVEVEKLRWGNELDVKTEWQIENKKALIVPLLLVPFIENAFKYVCRLPGQTGYINISCTEKEGLLSFYVENSYSDLVVSRKKDGAHGIGLQNVKKRLKLQYPGTHDLKIESEDNIYKVSLKLKLSDENDQ